MKSLLTFSCGTDLRSKSGPLRQGFDTNSPNDISLLKF